MTEPLTHCPECGKMLRHSWDFDAAGRQVATVLCIGYGGSCDYKKPIEAAMATEPLIAEQLAERQKLLDKRSTCPCECCVLNRTLAEENANLEATLRRCCAYTVRYTTGSEEKHAHDMGEKMERFLDADDVVNQAMCDYSKELSTARQRIAALMLALDQTTEQAEKCGDGVSPNQIEGNRQLLAELRQAKEKR